MNRGRANKKRGISAIVATVLLILITIVGVGIIWGGILPLFKGLNYISYSDIKLEVLTQGYTVYDPDMHFAFVQVARGNDNLNLTAVEIVFDINGSSVPYRNYDFPTKNSKKTYKFNFTHDGIVGAPNKVGVAPVFKLSGQEKLGEVVSSKLIPNQKIELTVTEWNESNVQALTSVVREDYQKELDIQNNVTSCTSNIPCDDGNSCTTGDTKICSGGRLGTCIGSVQQEVYNNNADENCDGWASINRCMALTQSGVSYDLSQNIIGTGPCVIINASNIVFDGKGKSIVANDSWGYAFMEDGSGIYAYDARNITIKNVNVQGVAQGLYIYGINSSLITGVTSKNNGYNGIWTTDSYYNTIEANDFSENGYDGIWLHWNSNNNTIKNNIVRESGYGLYIENAVGNTFQGNNFCSYVGVRGGLTSQIDLGNTYTTKESANWLGASQGTCPELPIKVYSCTNLNQAGKVYKIKQDVRQYNTGNCLVISASNIILEGLNHKVYGDAQINNLVYAANINNITIQNMVVDYGQEDIYLDTVTNSTLKNITVQRAKFNGFKIWNSRNLTFEDNRMSNNAWDAIWFYNSNNNTVKNNNMTGNGVGLWFESSQYNKISGNKICNTLDLECRPNGMGSPQIQIDLGSNTYGTQNQCTSWILPSTGSCN